MFHVEHFFWGHSVVSLDVIFYIANELPCSLLLLQKQS